jgi:hypothetical protein
MAVYVYELVVTWEEPSGDGSVSDVYGSNITWTSYIADGAIKLWGDHVPSRNEIITVGTPYGGSNFGPPPSYTSSYDITDTFGDAEVFANSSQPHSLEEMMGYDANTYTYSNYGPASLLAFEGVVDRTINALLAGNFFSATDALEKDIGSTGVNLVELLSEFRETISPETYLDAMKAFRKAGETNSFMALAKALSNANLLYKFGIAPTLDDADALGASANKLYQGFLNLSRSRVTYGSHVIGPVQLPRYPHSVKVVYSSKVRLLPVMEGLALFLLPAHALGILPTLGRVWESLPWSWLIDGLFDVSLAGEVIDNALIRELFEIEYSVNSISIIQPFTGQQLEETHAESVDPELDLGYKCYARYVLRGGVPLLSPTILPLFGNPGLPSIDILGSLVVQKAF